MIDGDRLEDVRQAVVHGRDGENLGAVEDVYADDASGRAEWVVLRVAEDPAALRYVPLRDARFAEGVLTVPYDRALVHAAPGPDEVQGHLSRSAEADIYLHYGLVDAADLADPGLLTDTRRAVVDTGPDRTPTAGEDTRPGTASGGGPAR